MVTGQVEGGTCRSAVVVGGGVNGVVKIGGRIGNKTRGKERGLNEQREICKYVKRLKKE